jgi:hypothetical protein
MNINPFNYCQTRFVAPLGVGLFSQVQTGDETPVPPFGSGYRILTQDSSDYREITQGGRRITTQAALLLRKKT